MNSTQKKVDLLSGLFGVSWGLMVLELIAIQFITGSLLALHYQPGFSSGHQSTLEIVRAVPMGWVIRGIHRYGAYSLVVFSFIHMFSVFYRRSFRGESVRGWLLGNMLLFLIMGSVFTGLLLPLDVLSACATRVALSLLASIPVAGELVSRLLFGFTEGGDFDPYLFHVVHVSLFPLFLVFLFWGHRLQGRKAMGLDMKKVVFFGAALAAVLVVVSAYFPPGLGDRFDPLQEVVHDVYPAWIFMSAYLLVSYTSTPGPWLSLSLILVLAWLSVPLLDGRLGSESSQRILTWLGIVLAAALILSTLLAYPLTGYR